VENNFDFMNFNPKLQNSVPPHGAPKFFNKSSTFPDRISNVKPKPLIVTAQLQKHSIASTKSSIAASKP
jgi:hypothetical protein